ncbi:tRNA (adenosine(37)-N6)-dimethylallyltransferase MiaA [bacterium]|nr:tRNA (adenosine(37)-N6)-dimethylallyltransferase MiaA [bacterium]
MNILLFGPTATGKTALAVALARRLGGEVVNADSRLLYKGLDIGTAKPDAKERAGVRHHLVDLAGPERLVTAGEWLAAARRTLGDLGGRGVPAVIVGGTGFYAKILLAGWDLGGIPPDPKSRAAWQEQEAGDQGSLHRSLAAVDPARAADLSSRDLPRLMRALELAAAGCRPGVGEPIDALAVGLEANPEALAERIGRRAALMAAAGLAREARGLWARHPQSPVLAATIGYAQFRDPETPEEDAMAAVVQATKILARRQRTWGRSLPLDHRLSAAGDPERLAAEVAAWL